MEGISGDVITSLYILLLLFELMSNNRCLDRVIYYKNKMMLNVTHAIITRCVEDSVRKTMYRVRVRQISYSSTQLIRAELPGIHAERKKENNVCFSNGRLSTELKMSLVVLTSNEKWEPFPNPDDDIARMDVLIGAKEHLLE